LGEVNHGHSQNHTRREKSFQRPNRWRENKNNFNKTEEDRKSQHRLGIGPPIKRKDAGSVTAKPSVRPSGKEK